jgi:hypothetical protein
VSKQPSGGKHHEARAGSGGKKSKSTVAAIPLGDMWSGKCSCRDAAGAILALIPDESTDKDAYTSTSVAVAEEMHDGALQEGVSVVTPCCRALHVKLVRA